MAISEKLNKYRRWLYPLVHHLSLPEISSERPVDLSRSILDLDVRRKQLSLAIVHVQRAVSYTAVYADSL